MKENLIQEPADYFILGRFTKEEDVCLPLQKSWVFLCVGLCKAPPEQGNAMGGNGWESLARGYADWVKERVFEAVVIVPVEGCKSFKKSWYMVSF